MTASMTAYGPSLHLPRCERMSAVEGRTEVTRASPSTRRVCSIRIIGVVKRVVAFSDMNQTRCASRQVYREALKVSEQAIRQSSLVSSAQDHARRMVCPKCFLPAGCTKAPTVTWF
jgi:predicted GNAT family N-acyltransferase